MCTACRLRKHAAMPRITAAGDDHHAVLHEKICAGSDPAPRRSKRLQDLGDAQALLEAHPELRETLAPEERAVLDRLPL